MMPEPSPRQLRRLLIIIFVVALLLRSAAVLAFGKADVLSTTESGVVAANIVGGKGFSFDLYGTRAEHPLVAFMPPAYPYLIAFCLAVFGQPALTLELINALLSSLTVLMLYGIGNRLARRAWVGLLAAGGAALYPVFILMCGSPASFTLDAFVLALVILTGLALRYRPTPVDAVKTGLALGIALLARPMLAGMFPILIVWLWLADPTLRGRLLTIAGVTAGCALIVILPWTIRTYKAEHRLVFIATNGGFNFWTGNNPFTTGSGLEVYSAGADDYLGRPHKANQPTIIDTRPYPMPKDIQAQAATLDETALDRMLYSAGLVFIRDNPARWLRLVRIKLFGFWAFRANVGAIYEESWTRYYKALYLALVGLVIPGLILSTRDWRAYALLYMLFAYYTVFYSAFQILSRYRWEIEPYFLIFAALTIEYVLARSPLSRTSRRSPVQTKV